MDQFLDSETDIKHQLLDPETDKKCQFLDGRPETALWISFWIQKLTLWARGTISGKFKVTSRQGKKKCKIKATSRQGQGNVKGGSRLGQSKVKEESSQGQDKVKVRLMQRKHSQLQFDGFLHNRN